MLRIFQRRRVTRICAEIKSHFYTCLYAVEFNNTSHILPGLQRGHFQKFLGTNIPNMYILSSFALIWLLSLPLSLSPSVFRQRVLRCSIETNYIYKLINSFHIMYKFPTYTPLGPSIFQ
jgi:hypothetical protein